MTQKRCPRCRERWPKDEEFFRSLHDRKGHTRLQSWCRACEAEWVADKRRRK